MKILKKIQLLFLALLALNFTVFTSCEDEEEPVYEKPTISLQGEDVTLMKPGAPVEFTFNIGAEGGLSSIIVNRDGGFLEEITLGDPDATSFTYTGQTVPGDAMEGQEIVYEFIGENTQELQSDPVSATISIAVYDEIDLNGTMVYDVTSTISADGVIPSGTTVKFAANRSYHVGLPADGLTELIFDEGSEWIIEEGVTVYMQSEIDLEVEVFGTINAEGTANNPIVMTSEKVLLAEEPDVADWAQFQIEGQGNGTNSGVFRYVRIEYAGDRAFLLDDVGNGTQVSHVQVWKCTDEGMFIADGDVNLSHLVVTDSEDAQYRLENEYTGNMQYILAVVSLQDDGDEAMYLRGSSAANISNVTVVGPGLIDGLGEPDGLRFWSSAGNKVYNSIVAELPSWGLRAEGDVDDGRPTPTDINGPVVFAHSYVFNTEVQSSSGNQGRDDGSIFLTEASFNNSTDPVAGIGPIDFVPDAAPASSFDPSTIDPFFESVNWAGAIENAANDWTIGWVKNPDGTIR